MNTSISEDGEKSLQAYHEALADILCWLDGYSAGGGKDNLEALNIRALKDLKADINGMAYHERTPTWLIR